jgi:hypothetical protein
MIVFAVFCTALFLGAFIPLLIDFLINGYFGWSVIVLGAIVMAWWILAPWFALRRSRAAVSWAAAAVSIPVFLWIVESHSAEKGWLVPLALPAAAAGLAAMGAIVWLWNHSRLKFRYAAALTFILLGLLSFLEYTLARPYWPADPSESVRMIPPPWSAVLALTSESSRVKVPSRSFKIPPPLAKAPPPGAGAVLFRIVEVWMRRMPWLRMPPPSGLRPFWIINPVISTVAGRGCIFPGPRDRQRVGPGRDADRLRAGTGVRHDHGLAQRTIRAGTDPVVRIGGFGDRYHGCAARQGGRAGAAGGEQQDQKYERPKNHQGDGSHPSLHDFSLGSCGGGKRKSAAAYEYLPLASPNNSIH